MKELFGRQLIVVSCVCRRVCSGTTGRSGGVRWVKFAALGRRRDLEELEFRGEKPGFGGQRWIGIIRGYEGTTARRPERDRR